jgi:hypothetical protein
MFKEEETQDLIVDLIVEEYRFLKSYSSIMNKLMTNEKEKYISVYNYHIDKLKEIMLKDNLRIVPLEGTKYDDGLSINPLNIEDFDKNDVLIIDQMIEPLIISSVNGAIIKSGTVILRKAKEEV